MVPKRKVQDFFSPHAAELVKRAMASSTWGPCKSGANLRARDGVVFTSRIVNFCFGKTIVALPGASFVGSNKGAPRSYA